jgi:hypothetical protein
MEFITDNFNGWLGIRLFTQPSEQLPVDANAGTTRNHSLTNSTGETRTDSALTKNRTIRRY